MKSNQMMLIIGLSLLMIGGVWGIEVLTNSRGPKTAEASTSESIVVPVPEQSDIGTSDETIATSNQTDVRSINEEPVSNIFDQLDSTVAVVPMDIAEVTAGSEPVAQSSLDSYIPVSNEPIVIVSEPYQSSLSSSSGGSGVSSGSESSSGGDVSSSAVASDVSASEGEGSSSGGGGGGGDTSSGSGGSGDTDTVSDGGLSTIINEISSGGPSLNKTEEVDSDCLASIFLNKLELMTNPSWSSRKLPYVEAMANMKKYNAFWCGQLLEQHYPEIFKDLKETEPERPIYHYMSGFTVSVVNTSEYLDYDYVGRYHPEWLLLTNHRTGNPRRMDDLMRWDVNSKGYYYNRFFLDVGNPAFRTWAVDSIVKMLRQRRDAGFNYDGLAMDNVLLRPWHTWKTSLYPNWKYADDEEQWVEAFYGYIEQLHDALSDNGFELILNHTTLYGDYAKREHWDRVLQISDGLMDEFCLIDSQRRLWVTEK